MLQLNPEAIEYFNAKAKALLFLLKPAPAEKKSEKIETASSHVFTQTITDKDLIDINISGTVNGFGRQTSRFFTHNNKAIGLRECDYTQFEELIENIYKKKEINQVLSENYIKDILFKWFQKKYIGELGDDL